MLRSRNFLDVRLSASGSDHASKAAHDWSASGRSNFAGSSMVVREWRRPRPWAPQQSQTRRAPLRDRSKALAKTEAAHLPAPHTPLVAADTLRDDHHHRSYPSSAGPPFLSFAISPSHRPRTCSTPFSAADRSRPKLAFVRPRNRMKRWPALGRKARTHRAARPQAVRRD